MIGWVGDWIRGRSHRRRSRGELTGAKERLRRACDEVLDHLDRLTAHANDTPRKHFYPLQGFHAACTNLVALEADAERPGEAVVTALCAVRDATSGVKKRGLIRAGDKAYVEEWATIRSRVVDLRERVG